MTEVIKNQSSHNSNLIYTCPDYYPPGSTDEDIKGFINRYQAWLDKCPFKFLNKTQELVVHPDDFVVEAGAHLTVRNIDKELEAYGLELGFYSAKNYTIERVIFEAIEDEIRPQILGLTVFDLKNRVSKSGGIVMKNVSGYDMRKIYVGSMASLVKLLRVNLKSCIKPEVSIFAKQEIDYEDFLKLDFKRIKMLVNNPFYLSSKLVFNEDKSHLMIKVDTAQIKSQICINELKNFLPQAEIKQAKYQKIYMDEEKFVRLLVNFQDTEAAIKLFSKLKADNKHFQVNFNPITNIFYLYGFDDFENFFVIPEVRKFLSVFSPAFKVFPVNFTSRQIEKKYNSFSPSYLDFLQRLKSQYDVDGCLNEGMLL